MIYLRNKLYIRWEIKESLKQEIINNFLAYIEKINKFKFIVVDFYVKRACLYDNPISLNLANSLTHIINEVDCAKYYGSLLNYNTKRFPRLNILELSEKLKDIEIKNEKLKNTFFCACHVDSVYIDVDGLFYYGVCNRKEFVCDLSKEVPTVRHHPAFCDNKKCKEKFTKCNIKEVKVKKDVVLDNPMFYIKWRLFNACNYHCSYCIRKDLDKSNNSFETLIEYAKKLNNIKIPFRLELIGGEPTLIDLRKFISYIENDNLKSVYISTNFSRDKNYFEDLSNYLHGRNIELVLSCSLHEAECNINEFLEKISYLSSIISKIYIECVSTDENKETIKMLKKYDCDGSLGNSVEFSIDYLRDRNDNVIAKKKYNFIHNKKDIFCDKEKLHHSDLSGFVSTGMKCKSNGLYIDVDGSIYGRSCKQKNYIANINDYDFNIKEDIINCPNAICNFSSNIEVFF